MFNCLQVYLVGHMAPGPDERQADALPNFEERYSRKYIQLIRRYSDIIVGQFFGHLHSDTFRVIYDEKGITKLKVIYEMDFF